MLSYVIAWVLPLLPPALVSDYALLIERYAQRERIDPLLLVAIVKVESDGSRWAKSGTNDYGLMQLHVSHTTHRRYLGRERLLFQPARNIRLGARLLTYWRQYHAKRCGKRRPHHWWAHYNWGGVVRSSAYGKRVAAVYSALLQVRLLSAGVT